MEERLQVLNPMILELRSYLRECCYAFDMTNFLRNGYYSKGALTAFRTAESLRGQLTRIVPPSRRIIHVKL